MFAWGRLVAYAGTGRHPFGGDADLELVHRIRIPIMTTLGLP
ncbi:hypothetical protein [Pseudofrankia sp. BMG5.36]|nr:hypothetical protein [Pseudofrankia sp. BMG5.36]